MGEEGETDIPQTQSWNATGRSVCKSRYSPFLPCLLTKEYRQIETTQYKPALTLIDSLLSELKRLDDKMVLTEVHLLESRVYRAIGNLAKAKVWMSTIVLERELSSYMLFHRLLWLRHEQRRTQFTARHSYRRGLISSLVSCMRKIRITQLHTHISSRHLKIWAHKMTPMLSVLSSICSSAKSCST